MDVFFLLTSLPLNLPSLLPAVALSSSPHHPSAPTSPGLMLCL